MLQLDEGYTINYHSDLTCLLLGLQGHAQGGHGMPAVPARAFSPTQAVAVAPGQIHSSCLVESLVSGAGGVQEGSHESSATEMAGRNLVSMGSQPSLQVCLSSHVPLRLQLLWSVTWDLPCGFLYVGHGPSRSAVQPSRWGIFSHCSGAVHA